jgi:hypothetical protein
MLKKLTIDKILKNGHRSLLCSGPLKQEKNNIAHYDYNGFGQTLTAFQAVKNVQKAVKIGKKKKKKKSKAPQALDWLAVNASAQAHDSLFIVYVYYFSNFYVEGFYCQQRLF